LKQRLECRPWRPRWLEPLNRRKQQQRRQMSHSLELLSCARQQLASSPVIHLLRWWKQPLQLALVQLSRLL
jgi:hypothetical protein